MLVIKDAIMKIGSESFEKYLSSVKFVPASSTITFQGMTPEAQYSDVTAPTYTCVIAFAQDWEEDDSLSSFLWDHVGETLPAEFAPQRGAGKFKVTANVTIVPGTIGGDVGAYATDSVTLGSDKPVRSVGTA